MRALASLALVTACGGSAAPVPGGDGESCSKPFFLAGSGTVELDGTTAGFADDDGNELSSCGGGGAPDVVFTFEATSATHVEATVTATGVGLAPIVKLRGAAHGCRDLDDVCASSSPAYVDGGTPAIGGIQYLIVDGAMQTAGPFHLTLVRR